MGKIHVTIWNEFLHETQAGPAGDWIRQFYPAGMHVLLKQKLQADDLDIRAVSLQDPGQGLPDEVLNTTDVLLWWGHGAHERVDEDVVRRAQARVHQGMGLIVLHSAHFSKLFRRLMGTSCRLRWREVGERERLWVVAPEHPIVQGVPESFALPNSEMYGEPFDVPDDGKVVLMSWYEGGNVFRSGIAFQRDAGRIFYFAPGHETYPIYHDENVIRIIGNAIRWAAPARILPPRVMNQPEALEPITTENPLLEIETGALHRAG